MNNILSGKHGMEDILLSSQVHAVCIVAETLQQRSVRRKCELRLKEKPCLRGGHRFQRKLLLEGDVSKPEPRSCNVSHGDNARSVEADKAHSGCSN